MEDTVTRDAFHSPPSGAEVKKGWSYTSIPPCNQADYTGMKLE